MTVGRAKECISKKAFSQSQTTTFIPVNLSLTVAANE